MSSTPGRIALQKRATGNLTVCAMSARNLRRGSPFWAGTQMSRHHYLI
jgi:hypothetical protein